MDDLQKAREQISQADAEMAKLFVKRMEAVAQVAAYKKAHGAPILDKAREEEVLRTGAERVDEDDLRGYYTDFLQDMMAISRRYQRRLNEGMRIAYSGTEGAFAHIAASRLFPDCEKIAHENFQAAYQAVVNGDCDAAVLPLENSLAGEVGQVTDLLFSGPLFINGTTSLSVTHDLVGVPGAQMQDIQAVVSHPQALSQCAKFIREHHFKEITYENTALAAKYVSEQKDKTLAAIASSDSAELYGLNILAHSIQEAQSNTTRFAVLSRAENRALASQPGAHFVLMFTVSNEAGSLARALNIIGAHGFNMRTLRSRPMKDLLWQYYFYVEAEGNIHGYEGRCMLEELQVCCSRVKGLGSFVE